MNANLRTAEKKPYEWKRKLKIKDRGKTREERRKANYEAVGGKE